MPSSGSHSGTPISGGGSAGSIDTLDFPPYTLLALPRYAQILGITPPHFAQASSDNYFPVGGCSDVWFLYSWQNSDQVSRYDLALAILNAEEEIATTLGYWPAPKWMSKEMHRYPQYYRPDLRGNGYNVQGQFKSLIPKYGKFIQAGRRAVSLIDDAVSVAYSDPDGDGYSERATVTVATSLTDACEVKVYFAGKSGAQEWEVRPARSRSISGGTFTATFDAWQLIDPDLQAAYPTSSALRAIDLEDGSSYVATVDVYREYADFTEASAEFSWEPKPSSGLVFPCTSCGGSGCLACENTTQDGCLHVRDVERGIVVPTPATYDEDEASWQGSSWTECREPDTVKIWYYAGELSERYLRGETCEPLSDYLAQTIAMLATARLERDICACNNAHVLARDWRKDLAFSDEAGSYQVSEDDLDNPFGTKVGEVKAWKRVSRLTTQVRSFALV